ncbi:MAG: FecR domain-containing protein, partial [Bacteroidetes bacterium]|nr:FecR domain-containing protein [Bacteroidota bacterium]
MQGSLITGMSTPHNTRIVYLWQRFSARKATPAELDELFALLATGEYDESSREYLRESLESAPEAAADPVRWQPVLDAILRPAEQTGISAPKRSPLRRIIRASMAAAAVLLLLVCIRLLLKNTDDGKIPATAGAITIPPGGNKAILTLAGGQQVILDSIANGTVAMQGNMQVLKLADGQLSYKQVEGASIVAYNTLTTPRGGQYQVVLPDGTRVWMNAASRLVYPTAFNGNERLVE